MMYVLTMKHLIEMYLDDGSEEEKAERREWYANERAAIQNKTYDGLDAKETEEKRKNEMTQLERDVAGRQLRKILDKTGKLEQIYNTRRSGAANNAKDWLRQMLNLDDRSEMYKYLDEKDQEVSDKSFQDRIKVELESIFGKTGDGADPDEDYYRESLSLIIREFGSDGEIVALYKDYKKHNSGADRNALRDKLEEILRDYFNSRRSS